MLLRNRCGVSFIKRNGFKYFFFVHLAARLTTYINLEKNPSLIKTSEFYLNTGILDLQFP